MRVRSCRSTSTSVRRLLNVGGVVHSIARRCRLGKTSSGPPCERCAADDRFTNVVGLATLLFVLWQLTPAWQVDRVAWVIGVRALELPLPLVARLLTCGVHFDVVAAKAEAR